MIIKGRTWRMLTSGERMCVLKYAAEETAKKWRERKFSEVVK